VTAWQVNSESSRRHYARTISIVGPVIPDPIPLDRVVAENSAGRAAAQVGQVMHAALLRNSPQPFSRDREKPAQQPAAATFELSQPRLPAVGAAAYPL
jgi:hypothetical protein